MTRWLVAGVAMAIVAVIAVALLQVDRAAKPNASPGVRVASASGASPMAANAPVVDTSALPPPNAPLAQVFGSLREAAAHGNAAAACRLAMEIQRCGALAYQVEGLQQIKRVPISELLLKGKFAESFARAVAEMRTKVDNDTPVCEGMPSPEVPPWRLLLDAGLQGHVPSMARFASGSALREAKGRGEWDLDAYGAYRAYALIFLRRAAEEGDAASIERLGVEHLTPGFGTRAIPYDPVRGLAYLKALSARASSSYRKQLDETADGLVATARMGSADIAAAATLAATVLPQGALTRLAGIAKPAHGPDDDFGCR